MESLSSLLPERPGTVRVLRSPRVHSTRSQTMRSGLCSRTKAQAKTDTPDQPIPTQTNGVVQTVVAAATSVLRLGQLGTPAEMVQQPPCERLPPGDVAGVMACITEDFAERAYFITGNISDRIYDGQCFFADPTVKFSGLAKWKGNLKLLVPFLVEPRIHLVKLEQDTQASFVLHIVQHVESWNITPVQAIKQIFTPGSDKAH